MGLIPPFLQGQVPVNGAEVEGTNLSTPPPVRTSKIGLMRSETLPFNASKAKKLLRLSHGLTGQITLSQFFECGSFHLTNPFTGQPKINPDLFQGPWFSTF